MFLKHSSDYSKFYNFIFNVYFYCINYTECYSLVGKFTLYATMKEARRSSSGIVQNINGILYSLSSSA